MQMIICKRLVHQDSLLQEAGPSAVDQDDPFYALVYAAKGPFVLYKIYNIIFEFLNMGMTPSPTPFEQC